MVRTYVRKTNRKNCTDALLIQARSLIADGVSISRTAEILYEDEDKYVVY